MAVFEKVQEIIVEELGKDAEEIKELRKANGLV